MPTHGLLPVAVALPIGLPAFGSCLGVGMAAMKVLERSARHPELMPELQTRFFLAVGVIDGAFIIATGIGLWFATANPVKWATCFDLALRSRSANAHSGSSLRC